MHKKISDNQLLLNKIFLVLLDSVIVITASLLGLLLRFDLDIDNPFFHLYVSSVLNYLPINIIVTVLVFRLFRLYQSLWIFAGVTELINIFSACVITSVLNCIGMILSGFPVPRSYYFLFMG